MALAINALTTAAAVQEAPELSAFTVAAVERAINAASARIARFCAREFGHNAAVTERLSGTGRPLLLLSRTPLVSIASITSMGALVDPSAYRIHDADVGSVLRMGTVWPRTEGFARFAASVDALPGMEEPDVVVVYAGGWRLPSMGAIPGTTDLPADVEQACIDLAASMLLGRGNDARVAAESVAGSSVSYAVGSSLGGIPADIADALESYRRHA